MVWAKYPWFRCLDPLGKSSAASLEHSELENGNHKPCITGPAAVEGSRPSKHRSHVSRLVVLLGSRF